MSADRPGWGRELQPVQFVALTICPTRVLCSDLLRTRETAAILGYDAPILEPRLREADLGDWTGQFVANIMLHSSDQYVAWRHGQYTPPNGESWQKLCQRVHAVLAGLSDCGETILVVTHGGPIRAACAEFLGLQPQNILPVRSASITIIEFKDHARLGVYNLRPDDVEFKRTD